MAKVNDKELAVARIYSRAMLDLAESQGLADEVLEELQWLAKKANDEEGFHHFLASPMVDPEQRSGSIDKMFRGKLSDVLVDALQVVNRKGRLGLVPTIAETYRQDLRDLRGRVDVHVETAVPLSTALRDKLLSSVAAFTGQTPQLHENVDESLIGGVVLRIGDQKVDASVKNEVRKYRSLLLDLAEREILGDREDALIED